MVGNGNAIEKYIVKENDSRLLEVWFEDIVHKVLKDGGCIGQAKGHDSEFELAIMNTKGCFVDISGGHVHLVIIGLEVKFGESGSSMQFIKHFVYSWDGKFMGNGCLVKCMAINAKASCVIFLFY